MTSRAESAAYFMHPELPQILVDSCPVLRHSLTNRSTPVLDFEQCRT
jgi:hypothetical protein